MVVCVCLITIQLRLQVVDLSVKDFLTSHKNHCQITHTGATVYRTHTHKHTTANEEIIKPDRKTSWIH